MKHWRDYVIGALISAVVMLWFKLNNVDERLGHAHVLALQNHGELLQISPRLNDVEYYQSIHEQWLTAIDGG